MTRMAAAWRKAGLGFENRRFVEATDEWERQQADAEGLVGRGPDSPAPPPPGRVDAHERSERSEPNPLRDDLSTQPCRMPGEPPSPHEELARLVWRVFIAPATPIRSVLFCGASADQHSDDVAVIVARLLAEHHAGTVCLVAATGAARLVDRRFTHNYGFNDASANFASARIERQGSGNLWLVSPESPASGSGDRAFTNDGLRELKEQFDFVIVAAPAVLAAPEATAIGAAVEGVILLIAEDTTRRDAAKVAIESLEASGGRILGAMLTNRSYPIPSALYRRL